MANEHSLYTPKSSLYSPKVSLYHTGYVLPDRNPRVTEDNAQRLTEDGLFYRVTEQVI